MANKNISPPGRLGTSADVLYTNSSGSPCAIINAVFCNTSSSPATITIYHVPSGSSATGSTTVISAKRVEEGDTYMATELVGMVVESGGGIYGLSSVDGVITADISGFEG